MYGISPYQPHFYVSFAGFKFAMLLRLHKNKTDSFLTRMNIVFLVFLVFDVFCNLYIEYQVIQAVTF